MVWQDGQHKLVFASSAQSRKIRKSIPPLVPIPISTPYQQETRIIFPSRGYDEHSTEAWNVPKSPLLQGGQSEVNASVMRGAQSRIESAVKRDENGLKFELQEEFLVDWPSNADADNAPIGEPPVPNYCCSTASKRKSISLEAPQLCQSNDNKKSKSCNPEARYCCRRSLSPEFLVPATKPKTTQTHEITTGLPQSGPMNIPSLLEQPEQQETVEYPICVPIDKWNESLNASFSDYTWTGEFCSARVETSINQTVTSFDTKFTPFEAPSANFDFDFDFDWKEIDESDFPIIGLEEDFPQYSAPGYFFGDKTLQRSAPSSLSSDELSEFDSWNSPCDMISWEWTSPEPASQFSTSFELSPASITPSTPEVSVSQNRSSDIRRRKSARREAWHACPIKHCSRRGTEGGFHRKDHLVQHLRTFHSWSHEDLVPGFCPHKGCCYSREPGNEKRVFSTFRDYSRHLRNGHDESVFNCPVPGCRRKGANGYSGQANLRRHVKTMHPHMIDKVMADQGHSFACLSDT
ncbi:uncharacterized protein PAC_06409 [Phialocephala subalpina]|uniref:C2H2-type domain-containing protein n=1 Tax=Phialocephala subalpina TaxID=576137 RepID=A0A1L7WUV0_9HELO|nr:uncharacterized protein PAC_06409 [Phialocephala subalpina]